MFGNLVKMIEGIVARITVTDQRKIVRKLDTNTEYLLSKFFYMLREASKDFSKEVIEIIVKKRVRENMFS